MLALYLTRSATCREHAGQIQKRLGYQDFHIPAEYFRMVRWLYTRAWRSAERPSVLFDLTTARLVKRKVLLPGVSVLARLVARVRDRAAMRLWRILSSALSAWQRGCLEKLLIVPRGSRISHLERLRQAPVRVSGPALVDALDRFEEIRNLGVGDLNLARVPPSRIKTLARYAAVASAYNIARMLPDEKRIATLIAFARIFEATALDDALNVLDLLITDITADANREGKKERMRTIRDLDAAALKLREACDVLVDESCACTLVRQTVFERIPKDSLLEAMSVVEALAKPPGDKYFEERRNKYLRTRRFLPKLLETVKFRNAPSGRPVLEAIEFLASIEGKTRPDLTEAPLEVVPKAWRRLVVASDGRVDRRAYTLCVLERLQDGLQRRDVFVSPSERWGDPRLKLLRGAEWEQARPGICRTLEHEQTATRELAALGRLLDAAYRRTAANLPTNAAVRIEQEDGCDTLILTGLDKLEEPSSLIELRPMVAGLLPRADLPEILLEINVRTGFTGEFTHISEGKARAKDLDVSVCAVLLASACNIGFEPLIHRGVPALTRDRLSWVQQNYVRAETLIRANARLVEAQTQIPLARSWGGGEVASADGLRFVVPVRTVNAGPNSKYFGVRRGITLYNFTSDQFTGFHNIVIPGTLRDSLYILEGLLEHQTCLKPREIMTDTAGSSDIVFGLFWLLGYQFCPRLADVGGTSFWRIDPAADYGLLNGIARQRINLDLIARNWDDLLRVAGSLLECTISASELTRSLLRTKRPSTLARAIRELGRVSKTLYLLLYIDDEAFRRRVLTQLNRGESRHSVARVICHGHRGQIRQRYREGQEDQLGALGLVLNTVVLWNTLYMDRILEHLRSQGIEPRTEDIERLSPLGHENINFLGRYSFALAESIRRGELRPLHQK